MLTVMGDMAGKHLLDFGCGKGDFFGFLMERGIPVSYCGIDVNENLVELARRKYPAARFLAVDIEESDLPSRFDIVFAIGVFNLRIAGIQDTVNHVMKKLFGLCRESLHVHFLTYYVPRRSVELFYVKPEELIAFAIREISPNITLRHAQEDIYLSVYK